MLRIISGKIGSGKTYYAVYHMLKNYYEYDTSLKEYVPKGSDFRIVTNIADFRLPCLNLDVEVEKAGGIDVFFSYEFQQSYGYRVVYIIDEAQKYFHRKYYNKEVFLYFQMHRHLGHDIYLVTQDEDTIAKEIRTLAEYIIRPVQRSSRIFNEFRYKVCVGDEVVRTVVLKANKDVFRLYQSQLSQEVEKPKRFQTRFLIYAGILFIVAGLGLYLFFSVFFSPPSQKKLEEKINQEYMKEVIEKRRKELLERVRKRQLSHQSLPSYPSVPHINHSPNIPDNRRVAYNSNFDYNTVYAYKYEGVKMGKHVFKSNNDIRTFPYIGGDYELICFLGSCYSLVCDFESCKQVAIKKDEHYVTDAMGVLGHSLSRDPHRITPETGDLVLY